jgi:PHP family Zn ribbon phosphoesterase
MGMYDESWCNSCGTSIPYTEKEDYEAYCGECASADTLDTLKYFVEERIEALTKLREGYQEEGDNELSDYSAGAIDAYDIVRMKLTDLRSIV